MCNELNKKEKYYLYGVLRDKLNVCKQRMNTKFKPKDRLLLDEKEMLEQLMLKIKG